jgi:hypothetical protein
VSSRGVFPVSVSLEGYSWGKGNGWRLRGWFELITFAMPCHHAGLGQLSQAAADRGGAQAAEFAQLLHGDRLI